MSQSESQAGCFSNFFRSMPCRNFFRQNRKAEGNARKHLANFRAPGAEPPQDAPCVGFSPCCDFSYGLQADWWSEDKPPSYSQLETDSFFRPEVAKTMEAKIDELDPELRKLSLQIHDHPEVAFKEKFAHDILTAYMSGHGFKVTPNYLGLDTAWRAEFTHGKGGRVLGVNSEMDALPNIGHGCGHNLIAVSGVGIALAVKEALEVHNVPGKIILLGTPAEEGGGGKIILIERGAYKEMDACIMCHPGPGPAHSAGLGPCIAMQGIEVEYFGHSAHAGGMPWEGTNALDAAFIAYSAIAVLRQQMKPDHRVHGIIHGKDWQPGVIPDYANMRWYIRAPTYAELTEFHTRVQDCFEAGAIATGCKLNIKRGVTYFDTRQNQTIAGEFANIIGERFGMVASYTRVAASTDFGNVTYEVPGFHPHFAIPTVPRGGNHTPEFAVAARTQEAHDATMVVTKGLSLTGFRVLNDNHFFKKVKDEFDATKGSEGWMGAKNTRTGYKVSRGVMVQQVNVLHAMLEQENHQSENNG